MGIPASVVKELREKTGAGMMECKKALEATKGDMEAAVDHLRKQGLAKAERKMSREAREGLIEAYIHPGNRLGVMVEVNCETDFVARTDQFKQLVRDIAMQVAATNPVAIARDRLPRETVDKEREIFQAQVEHMGKPAHVVDKIVGGKMEKFYQEVCLLEQSFVKDPDKTVEDLIKEKIAAIGENIEVRRFVRFQLGE